MFLSGGGIMGHPEGATAGVISIRQNYQNYGDTYRCALRNALYRRSTCR
jgi:ribulose 1,5-bisphosphate carboxylase large subunit-like protein